MTFSGILFYATFKLQTTLNLNSLGEVIEWYRIKEPNSDVGMSMLTECIVQILEKK